MTPILNAENITKDYGKEKILKGISLTIYKDTFTAILGPSGCGKSTLLNILSGITQPTTGTLRYEDKIVTNFTQSQLADWKRADVGNVFQNYLLLNNLTAEENIKVGICPGITPIAFDRLTHILEINDLLNKFPAQLSGGQQQRVAIARAVIKAPRLLPPLVIGNLQVALCSGYKRFRKTLIGQDILNHIPILKPFYFEYPVHLQHFSG